MPTPGANESKDDFISRCIPIMMDEGRDNEQAVAICHSIWRRKDQKKSDLTELSLVIRSVGLNKKTGKRYWKASTSDIYPDLYNDDMSLELYSSFLDKIKGGITPPEEFCSESWDGGLPYVSVAHYREHSIAGDTERVYVDGSVLKANGTFRDTPLGIACFNALCNDLYSNEDKHNERIRVSIAFLDYKHKHKSNGFVFERSDIDEFCPECLKERMDKSQPGRIFLDGLLIHFAMTRIPVNQRTLMEVEKSMTTKKDDATSIVGEELAEELDEKEKSLIGKSEAVVIKSDDPVEEVVQETALVTLGDILAKIEGVEKSLAVIEGALSSPKKEMEDEEDDEEEEKKKKKKMEEESQSHPLSEALSQLRSDFDSVALMSGTTDDKLRAIQESFNAVGLKIRELLSTSEEKSDAPTEQVVTDKLLNFLQNISDKLDLLNSQQKSQAVLPSSIPSPRSISPAVVPQIGQPVTKKPQEGQTPYLRSLIDKSVGLD